MSTEIQRHALGDIEHMAKAVAQSRMFPGVDNAQSAMVLMLLCEAEGLHPIQAMRRFHIIDGKPSMRADAIQAEFQRHGGRVEWLESTREECRAVFSHPQHAPKGFEVCVTFAEMREAGICGGKYGLKDNWKKFPRQMLRARVISEGVRAVDPGIVVGIYTPEEISDFDSRETPIETTARVIEPKPARVPSQDERDFDARVEQGFRDKAARKVADELVSQLNGPRVQERHQSALTTAAELKTAPKLDTTPRPDLRPYTAVITEACKQVNAWLDEACEEKGVEHKPAVVVNQVENHLATYAVETGVIRKDVLCNQQGIRTRGRVTAFLANWFDSQEADFTDMVKIYCSDKLKEACTLYGILYQATGEHGDGEPEVDAEDESQDTGDDEEAIEAD